MWLLQESLLISFILSLASCTTSPCNLEAIGDGVCVCTENYCDTLDTEEPLCGAYSLVTSSKSGKRFETTTDQIDHSPLPEPLPDWHLTLDRDTMYQSMNGFGGALTDASSEVIASMSKSLRDCVYKSYMSTKYGAAYNTLRIPLGASDFSNEPWAYNETPADDVNLTNMTELHPNDRLHVEQINEMSQHRSISDIRIMLCAWSPPPWMKSNRAWAGFSCLSRKYFETWALYHIKAIELWKKSNITIWSISTGNEPSLSAVIEFLSLGWTPYLQGIWISDYLKPMLQKHDLSDVLIAGVDDNLPMVPFYTHAYRKSWGNSDIDVDLINVHWYFDSLITADTIDRVLRRYNKPIFYTESCTGAGLDLFDLQRGPVLGSWKRGQVYIQKLINIFQHGTSGFVDWNMILNERGGPTYVANYVDAPMIFYKDTQTLYKQPMFYAIAHFSSFLQGNCVRIGAKLSHHCLPSIDAIAFICDGSKIVTILLNKGSGSQAITVIDEKIGHMNLTLDANSFNTLIFNNC